MKANLDREGYEEKGLVLTPTGQDVAESGIGVAR